jgi:hypothetical protein
MSTDYTVHKQGTKEVVIIESSARYNLDLDEYGPDDGYVLGPQGMTAEEAHAIQRRRNEQYSRETH